MSGKQGLHVIMVIPSLVDKVDLRYPALLVVMVIVPSDLSRPEYALFLIIVVATTQRLFAKDLYNGIRDPMSLPRAITKPFLQDRR